MDFMLFEQCTLISVGLFPVRFQLIPTISCSKLTTFLPLLQPTKCNTHSFCAARRFLFFRDVHICGYYYLLTLLKHFRSFSHFHEIHFVVVLLQRFTVYSLFSLLFRRQRYKLNMNIVEKWIYTCCFYVLYIVYVIYVRHTRSHTRAYIVYAYEFAVLNYIVCLWSFAVKMCNFCARLWWKTERECEWVRVAHMDFMFEFWNMGW